MPAETAVHERTWMAWPTAGYTLGSTTADAHEAWDAWSAVANAVAGFEPVTMLVPAEARAIARSRLDPQIEMVEAELDDGWYRDIGPTFVLAADAPGPADPAVGTGLGAVNWVFNGWGAQDWARWDHDAVASAVATSASGATAIDSPLVNEGGGIHTDGEGTVLVTDTVQLDQRRNPGWTREQVEAELARTIGARTVIWLPCGLTRDSQRYGTRGHVDIVATFSEPGRVLLHTQRDPSHPDHEVSRQLHQALEGRVDAAGRQLTIVDLPAPQALTDAEGFVDYSYVNHFVANGAVIACSFADPVDAEAHEILAAAYPGREIVGVDARPIFARGGGIHCITQQQPAVPSP